MPIPVRCLFLATLVFAALVSGCSDSSTSADAETVTDLQIRSSDDRLLGIGATLQLEALVFDGPGITRSFPVTWSSSAPEVAHVDAEGLVTSSGYGKTLITASAGGLNESVELDVVGGGDFFYESNDVTLSARLVLPDGEGPFPAIVTVHGSERGTKQVYQVPSLVGAGYAVLSYDKRGVGSSGGVYLGQGGTPITISTSSSAFQTLAGDVLAGVSFLKDHADIDSTRIGLMGWSQAGWIIPLAASRSDEVAFMVNVVGPGVTYGEEIYYSQLTGDSGSGPLPNGRTFEEVYEMVRMYQGPRGYDPIPILRRVNVPGLWVLGGMDRSIPTPITIERIQPLVDELGKPFTFHVYPNGNHGMVDVSTGTRIPFITGTGGVVEWLNGQ